MTSYEENLGLEIKVSYKWMTLFTNKKLTIPFPRILLGK